MGAAAYAVARQATAAREPIASTKGEQAKAEEQTAAETPPPVDNKMTTIARVRRSRERNSFSISPP